MKPFLLLLLIPAMVMADADDDDGSSAPVNLKPFPMYCMSGETPSDGGCKANGEKARCCIPKQHGDFKYRTQVMVASMNSHGVAECENNKKGTVYCEAPPR
ncbi:hypothetical protein C2857_000620 [Epichloe festucae Fl1]|uniref:Uncharacterized protein n=1 Tax=Epichloe festucae (strain Fl1) TaxID=877507 RepID=A0A7S9PX63_EPIFF|nr:hypothetical protein C2857_000620 [Epichloe festucae Fl1]